MSFGQDYTLTIYGLRFAWLPVKTLTGWAWFQKYGVRITMCITSLKSADKVDVISEADYNAAWMMHQLTDGPSNVRFVELMPSPQARVAMLINQVTGTWVKTVAK